jgi:hypothetical protein
MDVADAALASAVVASHEKAIANPAGKAPGLRNTEGTQTDVPATTAARNRGFGLSACRSQ